MIEGDGNVSVVLDHRYTITGHTFSMDLRLNRFVVAGGVTVKGPDADLHGAGFADFLDTQRIYFVPLLEEPDRWTFNDMDFAHPFKGREMPGDPFYLPDISDGRVTVSSTHAEIEPKTFIRFQPARILSLGVFIPAPSYVVTFSNNPDFRQNSLAGGLFDAPYDFAGSAHTMSTLHFRYDQTNGAYPSFEQHYVAPGGFAVGSINPLTRDVKQYNLVGLGRIAPKTQAYAFFQAFATQKGFSSPVSLSGFVSMQFTQVLRQSFMQLTLNQSYDSLLRMPSTCFTFPTTPVTNPPSCDYYYYGDPSHPWVPPHPFNGLLIWQGMDHPLLKHLPVQMRIRSSFGWAHDSFFAHYSYGLPPFLGTVYNSISYQSVGMTLYTKPIKLKNNVYFNASYDRNRQWFSLPHYIETNYANASLSKTFGTKVAVFAGYTINNTGDYYGAKQTIAYPPALYQSPVDNKVYPGFAAFRGIATSRTLYASAIYTTPDFTFNLLLKHNKDFPEPIPGSLGRPPYQAVGDLRFRISAHATMDIQRTYNFNYPGQAWSPNFTIQVLP
ncbi:MAG: hypothetical protein M3N19_12425 [Candidatus Eremiobacteraeota bacterium]|nr:hypothetical protein [Candidatus Eremiobacteraeota bacterium]